MAHHKRGRPKNRRAGCLYCKPHKANHAPLNERSRHSDWLRIEAAKDEIAEALDGGEFHGAHAKGHLGSAA